MIAAALFAIATLAPGDHRIPLGDRAYMLQRADA